MAGKATGTLIETGLRVDTTFEAYLSGKNLRSARLVGVLTAVLVPSGVTLDWFTHREEVATLFAIRLGVAVVALATIRLSYLKQAKKHTFFLGALPVLAAAIGVEVMVEYLEGYSSPYYAGLSQCILACGVIFYWRVNEIVAACATILAIWLVPTLAQGALIEIGPFFNNFFALVVSGLIAVASNRSRFNSARREFDARQAALRAVDRLTENDRLKSQFFANVSHELRTPLTLILSPLEVLLEEAEKLGPSVRSQLLAMQRSARRLLGLINNLLDLSKLEAGKVFLRYEPIEMKRFMEHTLPPFEVLANARSVELSFSADDVEAIQVDLEKMDMVFQNLLANALKFTGEGGRVHVRVKDSPSHVVVDVEDTGIGIAKEDLGIIFDRFGQADGSATRKFGGTGIGLALVKEIVELHGGQINVSSELDVGSTFTVKLPKGTAHVREELRDRRAVDVPVRLDRREANRDPVNAFAPKVGPAIDAECVEQDIALAVHERVDGPRVLVVEDNADLRHFVGSLLGKYYQVSFAVDGEEGIARAREERPDLIVSDVMMPGVSGYELTETLKSDPQTRSIPIILLTAKRGVDPALEGFAVGADDYLGKPFSTRELLARIRAQLKLRALTAQVAQMQKTNMLASMSAGLAHEVRNPINAIVNSVPVLRKALHELEGAPKESGIKLLGVVQDAAERINRMISDLLDFTNLDRAEVKSWHPEEGIDSSLKLLDHRADGIEVRRDYSYRHTVEGRPGQLNQVIINLLDNALRALDGSGRLSLTTQRRDGGVAITIADDGPGIAPDVVERIFDPFFTTRKAGQGTGLGLHLCKQIVDAHGGQLTVLSRPGKGASFTVWLPERTPAAEPHAVASLRSGAGAG